MMRYTPQSGKIPTGCIIVWSGAIVDIPIGFSLCDGNNGTPNLTDKFVIGAGVSYSPADTGGTETHNHTGDSVHTHLLGAGMDIQLGKDLSATTGAPQKPGETGNAGTLPPYYALAYIMKD